MSGEEKERIQWNFFGQTAASRCEGFQTIRELNPSPSSGRAGGLVEPETVQLHPEDGDVVPETSENIHISTRKSVRENFI